MPSQKTPKHGGRSGVGDGNPPLRRPGPVARQMTLGTAQGADWPLPAGGLFASIEGVDGAGKSTLTASLEERARSAGLLVISTSDPGGTETGSRLRQMIVEPGIVRDPRSELMLFAAARAALVAERIKPALEAGALVLCDRFSASMLAYQHYGRGLPRSHVEQANLLATRGLRPDITVLLDIEPESGLGRARRRNPVADRIESEAAEFYGRVRRGFLKEARAEPDRWLVLDATEAPETLANRAWQTIGALAETTG